MDFAFYDVDEKYIQFLKKLDKQVPDVKYDSNNKFVGKPIQAPPQIYFIQLSIFCGMQSHQYKRTLPVLQPTEDKQLHR